MKLAVAAVCLVAGISLAGQALADGATFVTLQQPLASRIQFIAHGANWNCGDTTCVAGLTPDESFGVSQCRDVAKRAGPVAVFKNQYKSLDAASLAECNAGISKH